MRISIFVNEREDEADTSGNIMAHDLQEYLTDLGHEVEISVGVKRDKMHKTHVLNLYEHRVPSIVKAARYMHLLSVTSVYVRNPKEFLLGEWVGILGQYGKPKASGVLLNSVCHSEFMYEWIKRDARKYFNASFARDVVSNHYCIPYGIRDEFSDEGKNDKNLIIVPFNRFDAGYKNFADHIETVTKFNQICTLKGLPQPTHLFRHGQNLGPKPKQAANYDTSVYQMEVQPRNRHDYIRDAKTYGMFLCTSVSESFGIYYLELLMSGAVGVFLDKPWVRKLLPDYKFICPKATLTETLFWCYTHYDEAKQYLREEVQPYIRERYMMRRFASQMADLIESSEGRE